jgi:2-phospho-L-lactate/phosphoenolpyruvate guanylyltransferase
VRILAIPVKSLERTKGRLANVMSPLERGALTLAMFEDVVDVALQLHGWQVWVVSSDEVVLDVAIRRGAFALTEDKPSLLGAIHQVDDEATERSADALAVLLADTPLLTPEALTRALRTLGPVVLAPAADRLGTNLMVRRPPRAIRPRFGFDPFSKHWREAAAKRLPVSIVELPELAFDLDTPEDILTLVDADRPGRTREVCLDLELESRIHVRA